MSIYAYTDPTADQAEDLFWSLVPVVAEQAGVTEADAFYHMQRAWRDRIKDIKPHHAVDHASDGRSAIWRVRLMIWRLGPEGQEELYGDSDDGAAFTEHHIAPGSTILNGLPSVAAWVRELAAMAHPSARLDGLEEVTLLNKIKSLRVSLSNSGGACVWRLRYAAVPPVVDAPAMDAPKLPGENMLKRVQARTQTLQHFRANVYVQREESPRGK